jgi:fumarylacetoacetate (FAA) hydrolase
MKLASLKEGGRDGTIVGAGWSCLAEVRVIETIERGAPETPFLRFGDRVRIEMLDDDGDSIFGAIDQQVVEYDGPGEGLDR